MADTLNLQINGKDHVLNRDDLNTFMRPRGRNNNDHNNKVRELAIYCMANNIIPNEWLNDQRWLTLNDDLHSFFNSLVDEYQGYECFMKGGRGSNYDFDIKYKIDEETSIVKKIEFKYGCQRITGCPQFLSLSANFDTNYSEKFYDNCVPQISELYGIDIPPKDEYLRCVRGTNYSKMEWFQHIYENEDEHKVEKKKIVDESIHNYLSTYINNIDLEKLQRKFNQTQSDKIYMCYCNGNFVKDQIETDELTLVGMDRLKAGRNRLNHTVILNTNSNTNIHMLLRWRNHAGILNPAWQIKLVR